MAYTSEVPETEAPPAVAAIYRDMRSVMGVGMVNLIYRQMATVPGLLEWTWGTLRPLFTSGEIASCRVSLVETLDLPPNAPLPPAALRIVGVDADKEATIARVLDDYNRGNSSNLFALTALLDFLDSGRADVAFTASTAPAESEEGPQLPPIVPMEAMDAATADLVRALSVPASPPDRPMIPSLYRHLAHWPGYLALVAATAFPLHAGGAIDAVTETLVHRADAVAATMVSRLAAPEGTRPPQGAAREELIATLRAYTAGPIPRMTALGLVFRRMLPVPSGTA